MSVFTIQSAQHADSFFAHQLFTPNITDTGRRFKRLEFVWSVANILTTFWLPAALLTICYVAILRQVLCLFRYSFTKHSNLPRSTTSLAETGRKWR